MALAQPSLSIESSSFPNHSITIQNRKYYLRFTNFVELMCPVFSQEMLKACLPVFNKTQGAYCLDHIWGGIEGRVPGRMGIIDDVAVTHTRPIGMNYDGSVAMKEGKKLSSLYFNIDDRYDVVGKIYRKNTIL